MSEEQLSGGEVERRRLSRRTLVKAGAALAGAAWVAPVVDSFASPAAAGSAHLPSFGCSWAYIVWKATTSDSVYYTAFTGDTDTVCGEASANPSGGHHNEPAVCCTDSNGDKNSYKLLFGSPIPPLSYSGKDIGSGNLTSPVKAPCDVFTYAGTDGRTIVAPGDIEILAIFAFGGGKATGTCPSKSGGGNSITVSCCGQS